MKVFLIAIAGLTLLAGCGSGGREQSMSDQEIKAAQERVKELEKNSPAPPPK